MMEPTVPVQREESSPTPPIELHALEVRPIPFVVAKETVTRHHYLHSLPGGTKLSFGVFLGKHLLGAITLGVGPKLVHCLVNGATPDDCLTLTRLWLSDELPFNSESRVIGIVLRALKRYTELKFVVTYADPSHGHAGTIYQATNWVYTGLSEPMPLYDIGDGNPRHSRSLGHHFGSHNIRYLARHGIEARLIPQAAKHRYIYFLDPAWRSRLKVNTLAYPKKEIAHEGD